MIRVKTYLRAVVILSAGMTSFSVAQVMEITRSTIDGGGVLRSTGGEFELSGTIGQPDAGALTGGGFQVNGGFWFELAPTDCNDDGSVNLFDYGSFAQCLTGPDGGVTAGCECYDVDLGGAVDLRDFATAQTAHTGP